MSIELLTATTFAQRVELYPGVALVEFWEPSCQPCLTVDSALEKLARQFEGKVHIGKLNVVEQPQIASRYCITNLPSVAIFRHGQLVHTLIGVQPDSGYQQALEEALRPGDAPNANEARSTGVKQHEIVVFSTPTCPWCSRLKAYLRQHQIPFKDKDVSRDPGAAQEMANRSGQMGVPQVWIDGQVVVGFDRQRLDNLLGLVRK